MGQFSVEIPPESGSVLSATQQIEGDYDSRHWQENGAYYGDHMISPMDLVGPWEEPAVIDPTKTDIITELTKMAVLLFLGVMVA
jgi:hypothetical protein